MKQIVLKSLLIPLFISVLVGCGNKDDSEDDGKLTGVCREAYEAQIKILEESNMQMPPEKVAQAKKQEKLRFIMMPTEQCKTTLSALKNI